MKTLFVEQGEYGWKVRFNLLNDGTLKILQYKNPIKDNHFNEIHLWGNNISNKLRQFLNENKELLERLEE